MEPTMGEQAGNPNLNHNSANFTLGEASGRGEAMSEQAAGEPISGGGGGQDVHPWLLEPLKMIEDLDPDYDYKAILENNSYEQLKRRAVLAVCKTLLEIDNTNREYNELTDEYDALDISYEQLQGKHDELNNSYEQLQGEHDELKNSYEQLQRASDADKEKIRKLGKKLRAKKRKRLH